MIFSNPITDATDSQIACNDDGTAGALQLTATVEAGSAITAYWNSRKKIYNTYSLNTESIKH